MAGGQVWIGPIVLASALLGCAETMAPAVALKSPPTDRALVRTPHNLEVAAREEEEDRIENEIRPHWIGVERGKLVETFGRPDVVLDTTMGREHWITSAYVYKMGMCVSAFLIDSHTDTVINYYCH